MTSLADNYVGFRSTSVSIDVERATNGPTNILAAMPSGQGLDTSPASPAVYSPYR